MAWLDAWPVNGAGWVLPELERCFLRHARGLDLVRRLLEAAVAGRLGRGIIACDSWAWAFLQRVWAIPQPEVYTLQAFDANRLAVHLLNPASAGAGHGLWVRNARTGEDVLPLGDVEGGVPASDEMRRLAAHCRDNPGIAWRYWRSHLRTEPDPSAADIDAENGQPADAWPADTDTMWWSSGRDPVMPADTGDDMAFVLHGLLLHNGLPEELLARLMPLSRDQLGAVLQRLARLGLVECDVRPWQVAPLGYTAARDFLRGRGYLVDAF